MAEEIKTRDERIAELLDKSAAEAVNGIKGPSLGDLVPEKKLEVAAEDADTEEEETPTGGKKIRIPKSRFETLTREVKELRTQVQSSQTYAERIAELEERLSQSRKEDNELPDWWKEAYGDNELSKQGYQSQQRIFREEMAREFERREAQRQAEESAREEQIATIEQSFDEQMDELEADLGRDLTATQKAELLDIVGEYSPQEDGRYLAYMPVNKAYEIWQKGQGVNQGKQEMARIAGTQSSGGTQSSSSSERPQWGGWRQKYGL